MTSFELDAMPEIAPFEFVATTENSEKQRVADILGIESSPDWEIVDRDDGAQLVMVHYVEDARTDYVKYGHLRGVVVDMEAGVAVAQSFGYNLTVVCDALTVDENSNLHIANPASGEDYVYPAHQVKISRAYDGFILWRIATRVSLTSVLTGRSILLILDGESPLSSWISIGKPEVLLRINSLT